MGRTIAGRARFEQPGIAGPTLQAISLDTPIFGGTEANLKDLLLRTADDRPVAFVLRPAPTTREHAVVRRIAAVQTGAKPVPPGGLEILFDAPKDETGPFDGIVIDTPLRDFEQQVRVFSSFDAVDWQPASPATVVFDYSRLVDVRNVEVPIERTSNRHFRLVIDDVTAEQARELHELSRHFRGGDETDRTDRSFVERRPFRVDAIKLLAKTVATEKTGVEKVPYPTAGFHTTEDPKRKQTIAEFETKGEPITKLTLLTSQTNFSRPVTLEMLRPANGADDWRIVNTQQISRFSIGSLKKDDLSMGFPEQRAKRYRLVVKNGDSAPIELTGVELEGPQYQMVFLASPDQELTLEYGRADARWADYDTAAIDRALAGGIVPEGVALGEATENGAAPPPPLTLTRVFGSGRVVAPLLGLLTIVLGWLLYRASRRIDLGPPG